MKIGETASNFRLQSIENLSEFRSEGRYFIHEKTGCQLYHLFNDNPENLFSFIFRTIPADNTGVAHIIEHSVLAGSEKFPLKDPFVQLLKSSMYTFLNAMTYPDKTVYPASSTVEADYFNLMTVYGDAVFFPLLREATFLQEGIRIERKEDGTYRHTGVVYNEMKGSYSDHTMVLAEWSGRSLFPDTCYRFDSGGVPADIKKLGYDDFRGFHQKYYHPANCMIFLYGNIDTERQLEFIESNFLSRFGKGEKSSAAALQKKMESPVYLEKYAHSEDGKGTTSITVNWLCGDSADPFETLKMDILSDLLIGSSGSPLYLSIIDSGLGEDLSPVSGLDASFRQMVFSGVIRGTLSDMRDSYERLLDKSLNDIHEKGFDKDLLEGTLRQFEFAHREIRGGRPEGLKLMDMCCHGWLHNFHPSKTIVFEPLMARIREEVKKDERYFEKLLYETLIDNRHRSIVTVVPDNGNGSSGQEEILSPEEAREKGEHDTAVFEAYNSSKDPEEDIAKIPVLSKNDIPVKVEIIDSVELKGKGLGAYLHSFYTAGITYTDIFYDISGMDESLKSYLPLFSRFVRECGLPGIPYYETARKLGLLTGGFFLSPESGMDVEGNFLEFLAVHYKSLSDIYPEATDFIHKLVFSGDFDDFSRLRDVLREALNDQKAMVVRRGNFIASAYASRNHTLSLKRLEQWSGISQLQFLQSLDPDSSSSLEKTALALKAIRKYLEKSGRVFVNLTSDESTLEKNYTTVSQYLPDTPDDSVMSKIQKPAVPSMDNICSQSDCIIVPSLVNFNSAVARSSRTGSAEYVHEKLLSRIIETGYLWDKVRMEGGAYGVSASANGMEGVFSFSSYRDPHIAETFDTFLKSLASVTSERLTAEALLKAVISGVGKEIRPLAPGEKGLLDTRRKIYGLDDSLRQEGRDLMLSAAPSDIVKAARLIESRFAGSSMCVVTGRENFSKYSSFFDSRRFRKTELNI